MNFLKRAMRAVTRRWVKSLLMLVIFFVIANLVLAGFAIRDATDTAKTAARQQLGATLTLSFDRQKAMRVAMSQQQGDTAEGNGNRGKGSRPGLSIETQPVTEEMAQLVAGLEHIVAYNYVVNASADAVDFDPVEESGDGGDSSTGETAAPPMPDGGRDTPERGSFTMPELTVVGVYSSALYSSFSSGSYTLTQGEALLYTADSEKAPDLVEETLAAYNEWQVGDTITISTVSSGSADDESDTQEAAAGKEYALTILGIYSAGAEETGGGFQMAFNQPYNQLIVDYQTAMDIKANTASGSLGGMGMLSSGEGIDSVIYYVDDPLNVEDVVTASAALDIDWETFTLDANSAAYESMVAPLNSVASFSTMLVVVVAAAGVAVLALILAMWIRERMYETGVLLSLGEGKGKVICQYVAEVLLVALAAFTLSIFSGMLISQKLGDFLLQQQTSSSAQQTPGGGMGGRPGDQQNRGGPGGGRFNFIGEQAGIRPESGITDLTVSVGWKTILQLYGVGILLVLAATAIPSALVMRYKPRDIFTRAG